MAFNQNPEPHFERIYAQVAAMPDEQVDEIHDQFQLYAHALEAGQCGQHMDPRTRAYEAAIMRVWCEATMIVTFERRAQMVADDERVARALAAAIE